MNKILYMLPLLASIACLSGCTTLVEGRKATSAEIEGIEYSLPVPIIRFTPMPDGTVSVAVEMMPDPDNTYRLKTKSFFSSYTLDVSRENGMLKSVALDAKADAVAAALVETHGRLIAAKAEAEAKEKTAAATADKERAAAISDATKALVIANAKRAAMTDKSKSEDVEKAEIDIAAAQATLDLLKRTSTGGALASMDTATGFVGKVPTSAAPVLFRIVPEPDTGGVRMVAFEGMERMLATSFAAKPDTQKANEPKLNLQLDPTSSLVRGKALFVKVNANKPSLTYDKSKTKLVNVMNVTQDLAPTTITSVTPMPTNDGRGTVLNIVLNDKTLAGSYILTVTVINTDGQPAQGNDIPLAINQK